MLENARGDHGVEVPVRKRQLQSVRHDEPGSRCVRNRHCHLRNAERSCPHASKPAPEGRRPPRRSRSRNRGQRAARRPRAGSGGKLIPRCVRSSSSFAIPRRTLSESVFGSGMVDEVPPLGEIRDAVVDGKRTAAGPAPERGGGPREARRDKRDRPVPCPRRVPISSILRISFSSSSKLAPETAAAVEQREEASATVSAWRTRLSSTSRSSA